MELACLSDNRGDLCSGGSPSLMGCRDLHRSRAWATQCASYFLTFTIFGSLIFEDDAKAIGPLYVLATDSYLFCSMLYLSYAELQQTRRKNFKWDLNQAQSFRVAPLFWTIITSLGTAHLIYLYTSPDSIENLCLPTATFADFVPFDIATEGFTTALQANACTG